MLDRPTRLWSLRRSGREISCFVRVLPHGFELSFAFDGRLPYYSRTFNDDEELRSEAAARRAELEAEGWATPHERGQRALDPNR
jgi:hypothetical protein